jgi:protein TonB
LVFSIAVHLVLLAVLVWVKYTRPPEEPLVAKAERLDERIVWIAMPGPRGGGGGGKPATPPPPQPAPPKAARTEETPPPAAPPVAVPELIPEPAEPQPPAPAVVAEAVSPGAAVTPATPADGREVGPGSGPGSGPGTGPGTDDGFGGDVFRAGNGVTAPIPIERASPAYTNEAVRAGAQGVVTLECVVEPSGQCGDVRVVRTFRPPHGLDQQAVAAARRWRFRPGTRDGQAVKVLVSLEIEFSIR